MRSVGAREKAQLRGALELLRALGAWRWRVCRLKQRLRTACVPVPRPRIAAAGELTRRAIDAARRGETVEVDIDEL